MTDRFAAKQIFQRFPQERRRSEVFNRNAIETLQTFGYDGIWCWNCDPPWRRWQTRIGIMFLPLPKETIKCWIYGITFLERPIVRSSGLTTDTTAGSTAGPLA